MPALLEVILRQSLLITGKIDLSGSCQNEKPDVLSGNKMPKPSGPAVTCWRYKYSSGWMVPTWRMRIRTVTVAVPWARQDSRLTKSGKLKLHASIRINLTFPLDNIFRTTDMTPTLRAQMGGHQPLICLNDQGGSVMDCSEDVTGTLRAQEHGHQPLVIKVLSGENADEKGP